MTRRGTLLILVAGVAALLAALVLAYAVRTRNAATEAGLLLRYGQARLCLFAACSYILEAGRIGWETDTYAPVTGNLTTPGGARHEEAFGWVDVRDSFMGPKSARYPDAITRDGGAMDSDGATYPAVAAERTRLGRSLTLAERQHVQPSPNFPVGTAARFPLGVPERPPFAISPALPNPILTPYSDPPVAITDSRFGEPLRTRPDPLPVNTQETGGSPATYVTDSADFRRGDPTLKAGTTALAWFRIYRDGPATFVITCGAGATQGFRDWAEVQATGNTALFLDDARLFRELVSNEARLWYRLEWSPAISAAGDEVSVNSFDVDYSPARDYVYNPDIYHDKARWSAGLTNACGTIQWVQRLDQPPLVW